MAPLSRRLIHAALSVGLSLLAVIAMAFAGAVVADAQRHVRPAAQEPTDLPTNRLSSSGAIVVAVVLGSSGTVGSDVLAPYEVFASSPDFSVYTIAARAVPAAVDGAEAGGLDGRKATSHWSRLGALKRSHPQVQWMGGRRFVQDGRTTTTAGVTSGIPGALKVLEDLAGTAEAERVGRLMNYPGWQGAAAAQIPDQSFAASDIPVGLNALLPWFRPTIAVGLFNVVGERRGLRVP